MATSSVLAPLSSYVCVAHLLKTRYCSLKVPPPSLPPDHYTSEHKAEIWLQLPSSYRDRQIFAFLLNVPVELNIPIDDAKINDLLWTFRRVFVAEQDKTRLQENFASATDYILNRNRKKVLRWSDNVGFSTWINEKVFSGGSNEATNWGYLVRNMLGYFTNLCADMCQVLDAPLTDRNAVIRKLNALRIRYSYKDQTLVWNYVRHKSSIKLTLLDRLADTYSEQQFLKLLFGVKNVCNNCGINNRQRFLWTCSSCSIDGCRHKNRYCSIACQLNDWPRHSSKHCI